MRHVADLVGVQHVALGSDFDGGTSTAFDATRVVLVTQALLDAGFSEDGVQPSWAATRSGCCSISCAEQKGSPSPRSKKRAACALLSFAPEQSASLDNQHNAPSNRTRDVRDQFACVNSLDALLALPSIRPNQHSEAR
jgi:hypothetical protein